MKRSICVVNQDKRINETFTDAVKDIFKENIIIKNYSIDDLIKKNRDDIDHNSLFIVPCESLKNKIKEYLSESEVIVGNFTFEVTSINKLLSIPENAKVLVVMSLEETALDTISVLREMGFTSYDYHPYWPGKIITEEYEVALTAGVPHLIPGKPSKVIDLGPRVLNVSTVSYIIQELGLYTKIVDEVMQKYYKELIQISINLSFYTTQLKITQSFMNNILNNIRSGIIALDMEGNIRFVNNQVRNMLKQQINIGDNINVLSLPLKELNELLVNKSTTMNKIKKINNENISIDFLPVNNYFDEDFGSLLIFKYVSSIQESEQVLRKQLIKKGYVTRYTFNDISGNNIKTIQAIKIAKQMADSDLSVLILGESGVGKELFAQSIHNYSSRSKKPFVAINFAGIPQSLVESELFGYDEGAFTGAKKGGHLGVFEQTHGGTLFLDEIGDASLNIQARLLRVLEEKKIIRVGGSEAIPVNVRIVAATNKNLVELMKRGKFREDLYYRLNVVPIIIPPLRERKEDIPIIIEEYLASLTIKIKFDKKLMNFLAEYQWPGNIRQLINTLNYLVTLNKDRDIIYLNDVNYIKLLLEYDGNNTMSNTTNIIQDLYPYYNNRQLLEKILEIISRNNAIGRYALYKNIIKGGIDISEYKLRKILGYLEGKGLVEIGRTKQGTKITSKGTSFLQQIKF